MTLDKLDPHTIKELPADPMDLYIFTDKPVTLHQLAALYKGKEGCSLHAIVTRSRSENWRELRRHAAKNIQKTINKKVVEKIADKKSNVIAKLNGDAIDVTQKLLKINMAKLQENIHNGHVALSPKDLRALTQNIIDLNHELRLYNNYQPDKPVEVTPEITDQNSDPLLDALGVSAESDWADGFNA